MKQIDVAQMIDISAVRSASSIDDILEVANLAKKHSFINAHTLPSWTKQMSKLIADTPGVFVGAPVGFPSGGHTTEVKILEAKGLIRDGVQEMDIVMNIGKFKSGEYDYVLNEIQDIIKIAPQYIKTKVIIEINALTDQEMLSAAKLVISSGADFLKTGTGWIPGDANIKRIALLKSQCKNDIKIKAAGGIRTKEEFETLVDLGVERFGINTKSALEILSRYPK